MIDERAYELLCCQLGLANEEKAGLRKQVNELIARLKAIEESNKENSKAMVDTINDLKESLEKQSSTVETDKTASKRRHPHKQHHAEQLYP